MSSFSRSLSLLFLTGIGLGEIIFYAPNPSLFLLGIHNLVIRSSFDTPLALLLGVGFLRDIYTSTLFGQSACCLILLILFLNRLSPTLRKLDNFLLIWLSYGGFLLSYLCLKNLFVFITHQTINLHIREFYYPFLLFCLYPIIYKTLSGHLSHKQQ